MTALRLFLAPVNNEFAELYRAAANAYNVVPYAERNSGFDLFSDANDVNPYIWGAMISQGCRALAVAPDGTARAFWLAPRSSICKTGWRLANSIGLIDATYRGIIKAAMDYRYNRADDVDVDMHARYCQLAAADLLPWAEVIVVDHLPGPDTVRGEGGFGSTGTGSDGP